MNIVLTALLPNKTEYEIEKFLRPSLAISYIVAYAKENITGDDSFKIVQPQELTECYTDELIILKLLEFDPQLIAFSVFLWNVQNTLRIIKRIRLLNPTVKILLGGPEVAFRPIDFINTGVDWVCTSDGEIPFYNLLLQLKKNKSFSKHLPGLFSLKNPSSNFVKNVFVENLDSIPSPYMSRIIDLNKSSWVDLETMRGCPFNCHFCTYKKFSSCLRSYSINKLTKEFELFHKNYISDIYIVDPTFNYSEERCIEICKSIAEINSDKLMNLSCELKAEFITHNMAKELHLANFNNIEVGLQTTNSASLKLINRQFNSQKFFDGVNSLKYYGINTSIGVIVGLPGDNINAISKTIDYVINNNFGKILLYKLQILPGTFFYNNANKLRISFNKQTPYYVKNTELLSESEIDDFLLNKSNIIEEFNRQFDYQYLKYNPIKGFNNTNKSKSSKSKKSKAA